MSLPWSGKTEKTNDLVNDDEFLILDSEDANPATKNKRAKIAKLRTLTNGAIFVGDENNLSEAFPTGLETKEDCRLATTSSDTDLDLTTGGNLMIDGSTANDNDRILVKNQDMDPEQNGLYIADSGQWFRTADANADSEVNNGMFTLVTAGGENVNTAWVLITSNPIIVDTTELTFNPFSLVGLVGKATIDNLTNKTFKGTENSFDNTSLRVKEVGVTPIFNLTIKPTTLNANRTVDFPALTGNDTFALLDVENTFLRNVNIGGDALQLRGVSATDTPSTSFEIQFQRHRTFGAGFVVKSGDSLGKVTFDGGTDGAFNNAEGARMECFATEDWAPGDHGTRFELRTTPKLGPVPILHLTIEDDGTADFHLNKIINVDSISIKSQNANLFTISSSIALAANQTINLPAIVADDTFALLGVPNVFTTSPLAGLEKSDVLSNSFEISLEKERVTGQIVGNNDSLGKVLFFGAFTTPGAAKAEGGKIEFLATETWGGSAHGTRFELYTSNNGTNVPALRLTIEENGTADFKLNTLSNVKNPTLTQDAATKNYVDIQFPVTVAQGGTGATTLTLGGVLFGAGTSAITSNAVPTGSILFGNAGVATIGVLDGDATIDNTGALTLVSTVVKTDQTNTYGAFLQNFAAATMRIPIADPPTIANAGDIGIDSSVAGFAYGILQYFATEAVGVVSMPLGQFTSPTNGHVITYDSDDNAFDLKPPINVKSGSIASIAEGSTASVVFATAFSGNPNIVVNFEGNVDHVGGQKGACLSVFNISLTGFTVRYDAASVAIDPATNVQWIATDAADF